MFSICARKPRISMTFFFAAGYNGGGVEFGFLRNVGVHGLQIVKPGKEFLVRAHGAPRLVSTGPITNDC